MFSTKPNTIEGWTCVYETGREYDAELIKGYLESLDIPCSMLNKKDRAYGLTIGDMALIWIYVPEDQLQRAQQALEEWNLEDEHLDAPEE
jgi:hypothetical protein